MLTRSPQGVLAAAVANPDSFATTLLIVFLDEYGTEGFGWEAQTIRQQLAHDLGCQVPEENLDKLMAAIAVLTTDSFFQSLPSFIALSAAIAGDAPSQGNLVLVDAQEAAWSMTEVLLWMYPLQEKEPFCDEIRRYLGEILKAEGFLTAPDVLAIAVDDQFTMGDPGPDLSDPGLGLALMDARREKNADVTDMIRSNLQELKEQLEVLPLKNGNAKQAVAKVFKLSNDPSALTRDPGGSGAAD